MARSASSWTCRLVCLFGLIMASFAILMVCILCRDGLSLSLCLVAVFTKFPSRFALLPGMVAFHTIDLQCLRMLLMGKCNFSISRIIFDHIFCKNTADDQNGKHKTC